MKIDSKAIAELIAEKLIKGDMESLDLSKLTTEMLLEDSVSPAPEEEEIVKPKLDMDPSMYMEIGDCFVVQQAIHKVLTRNVKSGAGYEPWHWEYIGSDLFK